MYQRFLKYYTYARIISRVNLCQTFCRYVYSRVRNERRAEKWGARVRGFERGAPKKKGDEKKNEMNIREETTETASNLSFE